MLEKLYDNVYRIIIPFEDIYTTSFVFVVREDCIIADSGTSEYDALTYIIPEIEKMGLTPKYLVSSHTHSDHSGGMMTLKEHFNKAISKSIAEGSAIDGEVLFDRFKILNLKGHTEDSIGIYDVVENVLFSFDSLQLRGIGKYRSGVSDMSLYAQSIDRIRELSPQMIIASHEYDPYGYMAKGNKAVSEYLDECLNAIKNVVE